MKNGWTGGQYSIVRAVLAIYVLMHFVGVLPLGAASPRPPLFPIVFRTVGAVLCMFFGIGLYDRAAALGLCGLWLCLFGRDWLFANPSLLLIAWLLLAHVFVPPAPFGSWAARGRVDPGGGWRMPPTIFAAAWIVLALAYVYGGFWGIPKESPFVFSFCILNLVIYHLFVFDPGWIRPQAGGVDRLFYDGYCGLCQRSVRLILAEDATGAAFRFAPLQGETFAALLSAEERDALPLSMVVRTEKGVLLTRSAGVLYILRRLGGMWRFLAGVLLLLPAAVRDRLYDGVARLRHRLFAQPAETCPLMPPRLRTRFEP